MPEGCCQIPTPQGENCIFIEVGSAYRNKVWKVRGAWSRVSADFLIFKDDSLTFGELFLCEESGASVSHCDQLLPTNRSVELEEEHVCIGLPDEPIDSDVVSDGVARLWERAMKCYGRIEKPVDCEPLGREIDSKPTGQEEISLPSFDRESSGHPVSVKIPGAGEDVVLGDYAPRPKAPLFALYENDPVDEVQRFIWQPNSCRISVERGKIFTERIPDFSDGVFHYAAAVQEKWIGPFL